MRLKKAPANFQRPTRGELFDAAFRTAVDYVGYREYDSEARAVASLRRRSRGFSRAEYRNALRRAVRLLGSIETVIAPFEPPYDGARVATAS